MNKYQKAIKNASWIVACRVVQSLISLLIGMIAARYLGPANYGLLGYANSIVAFAVPLAKLGFNHIIVEELVSFPENEGKTLGTTLCLSCLSGILCICGCLSFVSITNPGENDTLLVCGLYSISIFFEITEMIQHWFHAKLISKYVSISSLVSYLFVSVYKVYLLATGKSVFWFAASYALDYLIISVILFIVYKKLNGQRLSFSLKLGKKMFAKSKHYILPSMMLTIVSQTDRIMIKQLVGNVENGYYSTAVTCAGITGFVFMAIIDSLRPLVFESKKENVNKYKNNIALLYSLIIYLGLAQSLILTIFSYPIVSILYGQAYLPAAPILRIITWYITFSYMGNVRNIWMLSEGKQKYLLIVNMSGVVINISLNALLIPKFGAMGAAIASVITQFFANVGMCFIVRPLRPVLNIISYALNPKFIINSINSICKKGLRR